MSTSRSNSNANPDDRRNSNAVSENGSRHNSNAVPVGVSRRNSNASHHGSRRNSNAASDEVSRRSSNAVPEEVVPNIKEIIKRKSKKNPGQASFINYVLITIVFVITILGYPLNWDSVSTQHVFYYGWLTAVSTGLGVIPFFFISEPNKFWMGVSNAVAGGMMIAASYSLVREGIEFHGENYAFGILGSFEKLDLGLHSLSRTVFGFLLGIFFIVVTKKILDRYEDLSLEDVSGANAQRMVLIIFVMTLHSLTEGIGIGVSFGGKTGMKLGHFISMSLAMHNIPEGLAVALVMKSRKVGTLRTVLWAIFTSIPQPVFAVPAYLFVERFSPLLPGGLGFAGGAMTYVALFELLVEAAEDTSIPITGGVAVVACLVMAALQEAVKVSL